VLESRELFLVALAFALELLGNILLEDKRFEGIVSLLLSAGQTDGKASGVIFLLLDKRCKTAIFALVSFDLDFQLLGFFCELFCKGLEFEELETSSAPTHRLRRSASIPVVSNFRARLRGSCFAW